MPEEKVSRKADINKIPVTSANTASEYYPSPTGPIRRLDGLDEPPAADAGPRHFQQTNCPECKKRITVEVFLGDTAAPSVPQQPSETLKQMTVNNLPQGEVGVPQEAAPRPDCEMWSSPESVLAFDDELNGDGPDAEHGQSSEELGHSFAAHFKPAPPEATAPDWAMRAAEQINQRNRARGHVLKARNGSWADVMPTEEIAALIRHAGCKRERAIPPIEDQHEVAKDIAKQHNFDPRDASFARCVGAIMQAWREGGE